MATYSLPSRSSNCCEDGVLKCPETTCGSCGCEDMPCVSLTHETSARCSAEVARDSNGNPETDPSTGECLYDVDCNDPSHSGPFPKSSLVEEYDCCDETQNKYYDWFADITAEETMYLYTSYCETCPSSIDFYGNTVYPTCAGKYSDPIPLNWSAQVCGYVGFSGSIEYIYKNNQTEPSPLQAQYYFSLYINGEEQRPISSDKGFVKDEFFLGLWWQLDNGGDSIVVVSYSNQFANGENKNVYLECPGQDGSY